MIHSLALTNRHFTASLDLVIILYVGGVKISLAVPTELSVGLLNHCFIGIVYFYFFIDALSPRTINSKDGQEGPHKETEK